MEFLHEIEAIRALTFKPKTILSGWRKTGLWPYNPAVVLDNIPKEVINRMESPPPIRPPAPTTPTSTLRLANSMIARAHNYRKLFVDDVSRLAHGAITLACELRVAKRDLAEVTNQAQKRQKRQQQNLRQVQKGGVLYAKTARDAVLNREEREALTGKKAPGGAARLVQPTQATTAPYNVLVWDLSNNVSTG